MFLRAWYAVQPRKFYNPVTSLLLANKAEWMGMRLTGQIRRDEGLKTPSNVNSTYKVRVVYVSEALSNTFPTDYFNKLAGRTTASPIQFSEDSANASSLTSLCIENPLDTASTSENVLAISGSRHGT